VPEILRSRDCVVYVKDSSLPVVVSSSLVQGGWPGGQGVEWAGSVGDEFLVTYSRGKAAGMLVWGSDETGDSYVSSSRNQPYWRFATMIFGASLIATTSFERYTLGSRLAGPLVPIVYSSNSPLFFSMRGLWTSEDELTLSGDLAAPAIVAGYVSQTPKVSNRDYLGIQMAL
jgi:hypothetical protein